MRCRGKMQRSSDGRGSKGGDVAEEQTPHSWVGHQVEALIVSGWGMTDPQYGVPTSRSLTAWAQTGLLEDVNDLGIVASFEEEGAPTVISAFYLWSAVLRLRSLEQDLPSR